MRFHVVLLSAFILFLAGFPVAGGVEAPGIAWSKTYGGKYDEVAYALVETSDGGFAIFGCTAAFGDISGGDFCWLRLMNMETWSGTKRMVDHLTIGLGPWLRLLTEDSPWQVLRVPFTVDPQMFCWLGPDRSLGLPLFLSFRLKIGLTQRTVFH